MFSQDRAIRAADAYFGYPTEADIRGVSREGPNVIWSGQSALMDLSVTARAVLRPW